MILDRFRVPVAEASPEEMQAGAERVAHSARLALVDRGNRVVGYFDSRDPSDQAALTARAVRLDRAWLGWLPTVNAALNGLSCVLLLAGWYWIRRGNRARHQAAMLAAVVASGLFLACYLVYHALIGGGVPFSGTGRARLLYFTVLISHVILAAVLAPLVIVVLVRALRRQFDRHAPLARLTFPIWLYVSVTGVVIYVMLYQINWNESII